MRKKYLSALLFGALLFASAGTFTSCKDYDDDIKNLQGQIDANADAIKALQDLVNNGKYVTAVSGTGNTITFTFNDGTTTPITIDTESGQEAQTVTISEEGELLINGEGTGIFANQEVAPEEGLVKRQDGTWWVLGENGEYTNTNIPVSGVTVEGDEATGYTFTIVDANGQSQIVELPSATSSITDLIVLGTEGTGNVKLPYYTYTFAYNNNNSSKGAPARDKWAGPKALPKDGKIIAGLKTIPVQLNPTDVDGTAVKFGLIDSQNNIPSNVTLTAAENKSLVTFSRAAYGNGKYDLSMEDVFIATDKISEFENQFTAKDANDATVDRGYAVTAGKTHSQYVVVVSKSQQGLDLKTVQVNDVNDKIVGKAVTVGDADPSDNEDIVVNTNTWYSVAATEDAALYDMHLSVDKDDATLFGIQIEESEGSFTFRTNTKPDNISKVGFDLTVETVDKNGTYKKTILKIKQSDVITAGVVYDPISYELKNKNADENYFYISLDKMREALGEQGNALWNNQAELQNCVINFVDADNKVIGTKDAGEQTGINLVFVQKNENKVDEVDALKDANYIQFRITNATAAQYFDVNKQYTANIEFRKPATGSETLNEISVPFTLTLPSITTLFQLDSNFVIDGNAVCYMYAEDQADNTTDATFKLNRVFAKAETTGFTIELDDEIEVVDKMKSNQLATIDDVITNSTASKFDDKTMVTLKDEDPDGNSWKDKETGIQKGYGQVLTFHITGKFANAWAYPDGEGFTFTAKILSPIFEGNVTPREGSVVEIPASDLDGYKFGNGVIIGNTYNTQVTYDVLPIWKDSKSKFGRNDIKAVAAESGNERIFTIDKDPKPATPDTKDGDKTIKNDGYFEMHSQNAPQSATTNVNITVTDIWGYSKTSEVPVHITVE